MTKTRTPKPKTSAAQVPAKAPATLATLTRRRDRRLVYESQNHSLDTMQTTLLREAVARSTSVEKCAALLSITPAALRRLAGECRIPLMFVAQEGA